MWKQAKMHLLYPNLSESRIRFILSIPQNYNFEENILYSLSEDFDQKASQTIIETVLRKYSR